MGLISLVRHGQASFGTHDYDRLSELGRQQAATLGDHLRAQGRTPDLIVTGTMRRQRESLEGLVGRAGWQAVPVREERAWDEYDHEAIVAGAERGAPLPSEAVSSPDAANTPSGTVAYQQRLDAALALWMRAAADQRQFGHETWQEFLGRCRTGLDRVVGEAGPGRWVVVVTSAGPISLACARLAVSQALTPAPDAGPGNGTVDDAALHLWPALNRVLVNSSQSRIVVGRSGVTMLSFNEHQHLPSSLVTSR